MALAVPALLAANCRKTAEGVEWLERLPATVDALRELWELETVGSPFGAEASAAWVALATCADGSRAVLKVGLPHMEAEHEIQGLRFWDGDPTVRLLEADESLNAMLLERCEPGTHLRSLPLPDQDVVIARLLRRLWRVPAAPHPFRPLAEMTARWSSETLADRESWTDPALVQEGLRLLEELPRTATAEALLATDLHAGNVLRAQREPWLVIDPKPFLGDPAYDATQHLFNSPRVHEEPLETIRRFADLLEVDAERVRLWTFARAAAESRDDWEDDWTKLARLLARSSGL